MNAACYCCVALLTEVKNFVTLVAALPVPLNGSLTGSIAKSSESHGPWVVHKAGAGVQHRHLVSMPRVVTAAVSTIRLDSTTA